MAFSVASCWKHNTILVQMSLPVILNLSKNYSEFLASTLKRLGFSTKRRDIFVPQDLKRFFLPFVSQDDSLLHCDSVYSGGSPWPTPWP
jgi:hypothetical protein